MDKREVEWERLKAEQEENLVRIHTSSPIPHQWPNFESQPKEV